MVCDFYAECEAIARFLSMGHSTALFICQLNSFLGTLMDHLFLLWRGECLWANACHMHKHDNVHQRPVQDPLLGVAGGTIFFKCPVIQTLLDIFILSCFTSFHLITKLTILFYHRVTFIFSRDNYCLSASGKMWSLTNKFHYIVLYPVLDPVESNAD